MIQKMDYLRWTTRWTTEKDESFQRCKRCSLCSLSFNKVLMNVVFSITNISLSIVGAYGYIYRKLAEFTDYIDYKINAETRR